MLLSVRSIHPLSLKRSAGAARASACASARAYMHVLVGASMLAASREPVQHIFTTSKGRVITCVDEVGWTNGGDLDCQT